MFGSHRLATITLMVALIVGLVQRAIIAADAPATQPTETTQPSPEERGASILGLIEQGKWDAAQAYAQEWVTDEPNAGIPLFVIDVAMQVRGEEVKLSRGEYDFPYSDRTTMQKIANWARSATVDKPNSAELLILAAGAYGPAGIQDADMLAELLGKARKLAPENAFVLQSLGSVYGIQGKYDDAIELLLRAIEINPQSSRSLTALGVAYSKKHDEAKALASLRKAVEVNAGDGMAWFNLGSYYLEKGRTDEARVPLEKAVERLPKLLEARWNLGGVYFNSGEQSKAVQQLKEMIKIAPDSPMGRQAKEMLRQLGE